MNKSITCWGMVFSLVLSAFSGACSDASETDEPLGTLEEKGIRASLPQHTQDEIGTGIVLDPAAAFDRRRDVWEDDFHVLGEDPALWDQEGDLHRAVHGTRLVRQFGFQWMRSYARNGAIAFFPAKALDERPDGTVRLKTIAELASVLRLS